MKADCSNLRVYRCGVLIDGSGGEAREDVALVIDGGRIRSVDSWADAASALRATDVEDLRGHSVIPGLIDAHAHPCLGAPGSAAWKATAIDSIGIVGWGLASCSAALRTGVTTIVDAGSLDGLALRVGRLIDEGVSVGSTVIAAGAAITTTAGHGMEIGITADSPVELVRAVRQAVIGGAQVIKIMVTGGATDPSSNRRRAQYTEEELVTAINDAHRLGRRVIGHANATEGITRAVNAGIDIVAHCNWLGKDPATIVIDPETVDTMVRRGVWIDLNIQGALRDLSETDGAVVSWPYPDPKPSTRWELLQPLRRQGVPLYLTSDAFGPGLGGFTDALVRARRRWGISAEALVALVTGEPARALGIENEKGLLSVGAVADFVVLQGDLRSEPDALLKPTSVYQRGVEVVSGGRMIPPPAAMAAQVEVAAQQELLDTVFQELV